MKKLAIFDFGGTLANTFPVFAELLSDMAVRHGFRQVPKSEIEALRGLETNEILRELQIPLMQLPILLSDFNATMQRRVMEIRLFAGIDGTLRTLADHGILLALATSNSYCNVKQVLGQELMGRFSAIECGFALFEKGRGIAKILELTGTDSKDAIYIGDEVRDAHAARELGVRFGAVGWGYSESNALMLLRPDFAFETPADMLSLLTSS